MNGKLQRCLYRETCSNSAVSEFVYLRLYYKLSMCLLLELSKNINVEVVNLSFIAGDMNLDDLLKTIISWCQLWKVYLCTGM